MNYTHFAIHAILLTGDVRKEAMDPIVAGGCIVVELAKCSASSSANLIFQFLDKDHVGCIETWPATVLRTIEKAVLGGMVGNLAPFYAKEGIVVCFVDVDNSEAMNLVVARYFLVGNMGARGGLRGTCLPPKI